MYRIVTDLKTVKHFSQAREQAKEILKIKLHQLILDSANKISTKLVKQKEQKSSGETNNFHLHKIAGSITGSHLYR